MLRCRYIVTTITDIGCGWGQNDLDVVSSTGVACDCKEEKAGLEEQVVLHSR